MSDAMLQASDADLHRYVDGEGAQREREAVRQWLDVHEDDAARVDVWRLQRQLLHARFDGVLRESLPAALSLRASSATRFAISPQATGLHTGALRAEPPLTANLSDDSADFGTGHRLLGAYILGFCSALVLVCLLLLVHGN